MPWPEKPQAMQALALPGTAPTTSSPPNQVSIAMTVSSVIRAAHSSITAGCVDARRRLARPALTTSLVCRLQGTIRSTLPSPGEELKVTLDV